MSDKKKISIKSLKEFAAQKAPSVDLQALKENAAKAGDAMNERASEIKNSAMTIREDVANKLNELDRMLEESITEYNDAYTLMNDKGLQLFNERERSTDTIGFVEALVNSIANKPKSFEADFEEIETNREKFQGTLDFIIIRSGCNKCGTGVVRRRSIVCRRRWDGCRKCFFGNGRSHWMEHCWSIAIGHHSVILNSES